MDVCFSAAWSLSLESSNFVFKWPRALFPPSSVIRMDCLQIHGINFARWDGKRVNGGICQIVFYLEIGSILFSESGTKQFGYYLNKIVLQYSGSYCNSSARYCII